MSNREVPATYNEPTVIWRMHRDDGRRAWAAIDPRHGATRVIWFIDERPLGARYFEDWTGALAWCERLRAQYWSAGWRLTDDVKTGSLPRKGPDRPTAGSV